MKHAAIIGGGLTGLTAAIRMAEAGMRVTLLEAAPQLGGRTRSFMEPGTGEQVDNGPHLLVGAYAATRKLLEDAGIEQNVNWQKSLQLPLWDAGRGHFRLQPSPNLPLSLALPAAVAGLPGHHWRSITALLRLALRQPGQQTSVAQWFKELAIPKALQRDMLEPLCLGAMNESIETADARSFARVLEESFSGHGNARLGWFRRPLSEALISPLAERARQLGVDIRPGARVTGIVADKQHPAITLRSGRPVHAEYAILALPAHARDLMLGIRHAGETRPITNIHLWFDESELRLPAPFVGGIGTLGQWFFDIRQQMPETTTAHFCVVISAHNGREPGLLQQVTRELIALAGWAPNIGPRHWRVVTEQRATARVVDKDHSVAYPSLPEGVIDACEAPLSGELPSTIEAAVRRGEAAAERCLMSHS